MSTSSNPGLVVPINVAAFCLSTADVQLSPPNFSGATVQYATQTVGDSKGTPAYLGSNVWLPLTNPPHAPLQAGVHLHWQLPSALMTSSVRDGQPSVEFPPVPNRWLVTRFVIDGSSPTATSWVVESDELNQTPPAGQSAIPITIPLQPGSATDPSFAYLGQCTSLQDYVPSTGRKLLDKTGQELTAVSNGVPTFASYYPESSSVFGFFDPQADLPDQVNLMYVVTGWFDLATNDPALRNPGLAAALGWKTDEDPSYTLYSGSVQNIAWNSHTKFVFEGPNLQPIAAQAAVGNTPAEALAAYFRALDAPGNTLYESVLQAFQSGALPGLSEPDPGLLATLAESLHNQQFQAIDAGLTYAIVLENPDGTEAEARDLTQPLADALNQLNLASQALQESANTVSSFQWEMFANWYRYFQADRSLNSTVYSRSNVLHGEWPKIQNAYNEAAAAFEQQLKSMEAALQGTGLTLKAGPAARYWQPTDPVVLLASADLSVPPGDTEASSTSDGILLCRQTNQLVSEVTVAETTIAASGFSTACALSSAVLPYATDCSNLLMEACLLNTQIASSLSDQSSSTLQTTLQQLLNGEQQQVWIVLAGTAPTPIEVSWWGPNNPWMPILLQWSVEFEPLFSTQFSSGAPVPGYPMDYFTANYTIDPATGSFVAYTPKGSGSIAVDPAISPSVTQQWSGQSILSGTSAANLAEAIATHLVVQPDPNLQTIFDHLEAMPTLVQALSGFTLGLLQQQQIPQLQLVVPAGSAYQSKTITTNTAEVVGTFHDVGPQFNWYYNPIRGGWFRIAPKEPAGPPLLYAVDVFGQKRAIHLTSVSESQSMASFSSDGQPVAGLSYAAPRLAQPARLLFEWISAASAGLVEMNDQPASSPVCGWLLPNHLSGGFFLYDDSGRPLGSLQLNGDRTTVQWQSAPGDNATINLDIEHALATVNPVLQELAFALKDSSPAWFLDFWSAIDRAHGAISTDNLATDAGLSVLIGRPVAVAQAALRLEVRGRPSLNQSWSCLSANEWIVTDNAFTSVQFPAVLGDIDNLNDGLIGFFLPDAGGDYDLSTFYSEAASSTATSGVVQPGQDTILLTPTPKYDEPNSPPLAAETLSVLVLLDPRAPVHATTGILPTQRLIIPTDIAVAGLNALEMWFLVAPILKSSGALALPVPREPGYAVSFVEEGIDSSKQPKWHTEPEISAPTSNAVWGYTPQTLVEGWLRLNPERLSVEVLNGLDATAPIRGGQSQTVLIRVTNCKPARLKFVPGELVPEGDSSSGSILYFHLGALVAQDDVSAMVLSAPGWTFMPMEDSTYGAYWAATPVTLAQLEPTGYIDITVRGLIAARETDQARVSTAYYSIGGISDGVFVDIVTIQQESAATL